MYTHARCSLKALVSSDEVITFPPDPQVPGSSQGRSDVETSRPIIALGVCGRASDACACHLVCCVVETQLMLWSVGDCSCVQCSSQHYHGNQQLIGQWKQIFQVTLAKVS